MIAFGAISYGLVGAMYLVLAILLFTNWRGHRAGAYLAVASMVSTLWASSLALQFASDSVAPMLLFLAEVARGAAWLAFLAYLAGQAGISPGIRRLAHLVWLAVLCAGLYIWIESVALNRAGNIGFVLNYGGLAISLVGLILLEQLFRNATPASRNYLKMLVLGVGGIFAYDMFLYSQGVLFAVNDTATWIARGAVNLLFVPLIAIAVRRSREWGLQIFVSRQVVFYTTTLTTVGLYLLLMSFGGYLLLRFGGTWGGVARIMFFAGAALVLFVLLFSSTMRARLKVVLNKHFYRNKYDYREEWMRLVSTLANFGDSSTREIVVKAMAQIVDSPAGVLWMLDDDERVYRRAASLDYDVTVADIAVDDPLVEFIKKDSWLIDFDEFRRIPEMYSGLELPVWLEPHSRAWLIVPLVSRQQLLGMIMLCEPQVVPMLKYEDRDLLKTVGSHIGVHLAQEKSDSLLVQAVQFAAYNRLTAFLMHDLNNLIAQQSLIVENAKRYRDNPDFVNDAFETIASGVTRMRKVIDHLNQRSADNPKEKIELGKLIMQVTSHCEDREPVPVARVGELPVWISGDRDRVFMALTHAIRNAQDATPDDGEITASLESTADQAVITITDTGCGMDEQFIRERLFKPFDSTKGTRGMGIGAYQIRETIRALGGDVAVKSVPNEGSSFVFSLVRSN
ncbi:MAG: PEP-CTERM system histidine kinase PrsK [Woeseia sp.]